MVEIGGKNLKKLPFWFPKKDNFIWYLITIILFLLSIDIWWWERSKPLIYGLPFWVLYIFFLTIITSLVFYTISKKIWRDEN